MCLGAMTVLRSRALDHPRSRGDLRNRIRAEIGDIDFSALKLEKAMGVGKSTALRRGLADNGGVMLDASRAGTRLVLA
jgi:hypothetical protein